jgi:alanyl-tRNA synthetase
MRLFQKFTDEIKADDNSNSDSNSDADQSSVPGDIAFKLYDTFGFPLDLTQLMAEEIGMTVDVRGYQELMEAAQVRSRQESKNIHFSLSDNEKHILESEKNIAPTNDEFKYKWQNIACTVVAIFDGNSRQFVECVSKENGGDIGVILNNSPFYAESGGQVCDIGYIEDAKEDSNENENAFKVSDCIEFGGYVVHIGEVVFGALHVGQQYTTNVSYDHRGLVAPNHTMTHVLNLFAQSDGHRVQPERILGERG